MGLKKSKHGAEGAIFRKLYPSGQPGQEMIEYHPGEGRHGPNPYWKVSSGMQGITHVGPDFLDSLFDVDVLQRIQ